MGSYKDGHNANILQRDTITSVNHHKSITLERSLIFTIGGGTYTCFTASKPSPLASAVVQNIRSA